MPISTYNPNWEALKSFFAKMDKLIPKGYTGFIAIRLHRTGNPLTLEMFGTEVPDRPLYPLVLIEVNKGRFVRDWGYLAEQYDVPWVRPDDFHKYRVDVMTFYHAEDLLEPVAEEILSTAQPSEDLLKKALADSAAIAART